MCGMWPIASLVFDFVYAPVRTGHLAKERAISYSFSLYLYSWYSGLVTLIFRTFLMLGGYKFRVVDYLMLVHSASVTLRPSRHPMSIVLVCSLDAFPLPQRIARLSLLCLLHASLMRFSGLIRSRGG